MSGFHPVRFPEEWSVRARIIIDNTVDVTTRASGFEERNTKARGPLRRYVIDECIAPAPLVQSLVAFHAARGGAFASFLLQDPLDWRSCLTTGPLHWSDQILGVGNGQQRRFALKKTYGELQGAFMRTIRRPIVESVRVGVNTSETTNFSVDSMSGEVLLVQAPPQGAVVKAGFRFDVQVRFDTAALAIEMLADGAARVSQFSLVETNSP